MNKLQTFLFLTVILINVVVNLYFYTKTRKHAVYKWTSVLWVFSLLFLVAQAAATNVQIIGITAIFAGITDFAIMKVMSYLFQKKSNDRFYYKVVGSLYLIGILSSFFLDFKYFTIPIVIGCAFPYLHYMVKNYKTIFKSSLLKQFMIFGYLLNIFHILDFPITRLDPALAGMSFDFAFTSVLFLSMFIHIAADHIYLNTIENQLKKYNDEKNSLYKSFIANEIMKSFSHELNNAMQNMSLSQELLEIKAESEKDESLKRVSENFKSGLNKMEKILIPIYNSDATEYRENISCEKIVSEVNSLMSQNISQYGWSVNFEFCDDKIIYNSSKGLFVQLLVNLIKNVVQIQKEAWILMSNEEIVIKVKENTDISKFDLDLVRMISNQLNYNLSIDKKLIKISNLSVQQQKKSA